MMQQVGAAGQDQAVRLLAEQLGQLVEAITDSVGSLPDGSMPVGPIEPATKRGPRGGRELVADLARQPRGGGVVLERDLAQPPLLELRRVAWNEFVSTYVGSGLEVGAVDVADEVPAVSVRWSFAPSLPPKSPRVQVGVLDLGAHRAVEHQRALAQELEVLVRAAHAAASLVELRVMVLSFVIAPSSHRTPGRRRRPHPSTVFADPAL